MNIGKIDSNVLYESFGYDKDYLIKLINDLDFLKDSTLKELYYFSPKGEDPFLLSLTGKKDLLSNYKNRDKESEYEHEFENYMNDIENGNKRYNNYLNYAQIMKVMTTRNSAMVKNIKYCLLVKNYLV